MEHLQIGNEKQSKGSTMRNTIYSSIASLSLLALAACGGGGKKPDPPPVPTFATSLDYTNPASGDFKLMKSTSESTATRLVLELHGPAQSGRGVTFSFQVDASKVDFVKISSADPEYAQAVAGGFNLGEAPQLFKAVLDGNNTLRASIAQKGNPQGTPPGPAAIDMNRPLAKVALQLKSNVSVGAVSITALEAKYLPASPGKAQSSNLGVGALAAK
jgi:hypothetical protein